MALTQLQRTGMVTLVAMCAQLSSCAGSLQVTKRSTSTNAEESDDRPDTPADESTIPTATQLEALKSVLIQAGIGEGQANRIWSENADPLASLASNIALVAKAITTAIARNIEGVSSNWSSGDSSGSNSLNRGNSNQSAALAADASDSNGCLGITSNGDPADNCGSAWHVNKRTHTLSNGEVIWDIAGNVWEWVQDNLTSQG